MLVLTVVPESLVRGRFDLPGAIGRSGGLFSLLLAISDGGKWGWTNARTGGLTGAAVLVLLLWGWWELRSAQPLVDQTIVTVGVVMAPTGLVMMAMAPLSARISRRRGPKTTLMVGAAYAAGIGLMSAIWQLVLGSSVIGAGIGLAYGAMPGLIMAAVPVTETAATNSLNTLMRSIGTSISSATGPRSMIVARAPRSTTDPGMAHVLCARSPIVSRVRFSPNAPGHLGDRQGTSQQVEPDYRYHAATFSTLTVSAM